MGTPGGKLMMGPSRRRVGSGMARVKWKPPKYDAEWPTGKSKNARGSGDLPKPGTEAYKKFIAAWKPPKINLAPKATGSAKKLDLGQIPATGKNLASRPNPTDVDAIIPEVTQ